MFSSLFHAAYPYIDSTAKLTAHAIQPNGNGFITSAELLDLRKRCFRISTGSRQWDAILLGGFQSCSINEVYAKPFVRDLVSGICADGA